MSKLRNAAGGLTIAGALAVGVVGQYEGLRTTTYRDSIGVPTVCVGETKGIRMGMHFTKQQCQDMFGKRLDEFANKIEGCIRGTMPAKVEVAFVSLGYNIGTGGFCKSSTARRWNAGDKRGACEAMLIYNRAGGRVLAGLDRRRHSERALCLQGLKEAA